MEQIVMDFYQQIIDNIRRIGRDKGLKQATIAEYLGVEPPTASKMLNRRSGQITFQQLSNFARALSMREIDVITYPDVYQAPDEKRDSSSEVLLQMRLTKEKKEQVLKLVFGENNIEILNK